MLTGLFTWLQNQREIRENNVRIYAELMSQREGADSALRKDMFSSIIGTFLKPASGSRVEQQILHLLGCRLAFGDHFQVCQLHVVVVCRL